MFSHRKILQKEADDMIHVFESKLTDEHRQKHLQERDQPDDKLIDYVKDLRAVFIKQLQKRVNMAKQYLQHLIVLAQDDKSAKAWIYASKKITDELDAFLKKAPTYYEINEKINQWIKPQLKNKNELNYRNLPELKEALENRVLSKAVAAHTRINELNKKYLGFIQGGISIQLSYYDKLSEKYEKISRDANKTSNYIEFADFTRRLKETVKLSQEAEQLIKKMPTERHKELKGELAEAVFDLSVDTFIQSLQPAPNVELSPITVFHFLSEKPKMPKHVQMPFSQSRENSPERKGVETELVEMRKTPSRLTPS